ncbi:MAG: hypothetical protein CM15mP125_0190 [Gammaproteobacteria bacterium]|nr:MAG: hypothetical protein CM15mP125_0190 [Gammaproteobacteria bacterium]
MAVPGRRKSLCRANTPADDISPTSARGIQREAQILQAIADYPVKAPGVLAWCDDETVIGRPFLVQEWVDGVALTDALPSAYADSPDSVNRLGEDLIRSAGCAPRRAYRFGSTCEAGASRALC